MHPKIIFAKFQTHSNVIPSTYITYNINMKEVPRRRNVGTKRTSMHGEDVMRWGVIPIQFPFITYGMELYINDSIPTNTRNIEQMYVYASERSERA